MLRYLDFIVFPMRENNAVRPEAGTTDFFILIKLLDNYETLVGINSKTKLMLDKIYTRMLQNLNRKLIDNEQPRPRGRGCEASEL